MVRRIRQLALVARDLELVVQQICKALAVDVCFRDPGVGQFGLRNALMAIGNTFLEVVSPFKADTTAGRLLSHRKGDGGYMVLLQTDDLAGDRARCEALGVRVVWKIELDDIAAMHLHPKDVGAAILSFDEPKPPESWRWGGPEWDQHQHLDRVTGIVGADLQSADPRALSSRWAEVLDRPAHGLEDGCHGIDLDGGQQLRFVPDRDGRGDGLSAVVMRRAPGCTLRDTELCGTRFRFVD